nr:hypothetical protein [uncultured Methanoregula sp.]
MSADPEAGREEPKKRGAKSPYAEEMFERVRSRVAEGMPVPTAIQAAGMCVSQFYATVAEHPEWKVALQKARLERRVERLEDESCRRIFIGDSRLVFWKGEQVGEIREPSIGMLIFMMKTLSPERYANTKAAAKRRAQLDGLEASRARVLVNAQRGVKIMQGHYRDYLKRCGVPVPPGDSDQSSVNSDQSSVNSDQSSVNSDQSSVNSDQSSVNSDQSSVNSDQLSVNSDQSSGNGDQSSVNSDQSSVNSDQLSGDSGQRAEDSGQRAEDSGQKAEDSGQLSGENPEAGQGGDYDCDPDYNPEPKLPPPYEPWWRPGMDVTVTMLEDEAYRLAIEGVLKPIYQRGTEVGERRVRSERLLQFLLITSAFKKYGRREVGPLQAEEEPGRPEFMAKLNAIYGQDEELHRKFTEVFERNNARRHAERLADLERKNRASKAPPCTHGAFGAEDTAAGQKGNRTLDHDLDLVPSGSKAPHWGEDRETGRRGDTETGQRKRDQLSVSSQQSAVNSQQSAVNSEWDVLDFDQFSAAVAAARGEDAATGRHGDTESKTPPATPVETPECSESGRQSRAQMVDNETIARQENPAERGSNQSSVSSDQLSVNSDQLSVSKAPPCTHGASGAEDTAGTVNRGQKAEDSGQLSGEGGSDRSSVPPSGEDTATGQRGNLTLDHDPSSVAEPLRRGDLNHNLDLVPSGSAGVYRPGPAANKPAAGTAENQGVPPPEHDAAWYSPSARAARITQSMIEHRLRRRRVEM